jgi:GWxTD domain-containing protein
LKRISLFLLLLCGVIFPQQPAGDFLLSSVYLLPSGNVYKVYFAYRLPYNRLVFEKDNSVYKAEYSIGLEVFDSTGNFVIRNSGSKKLTVSDYESTNSKYIYTEGIVELPVNKGSYKFLPILTDIKSGDEIKLKEISINTSDYSGGKYLEPIVTDSLSVPCDGIISYTLTNFEGNIPFSEFQYNIIIPVADTAINKIYVTIAGSADTVFSGYADKSEIYGVGFKECDNKIIIQKDTSVKATKNFLIPGFNSRLEPGELKISISDSSKPKADKEFKRAVVWYNKPKSLNNIEFAVKALKYIGENSAVRDINKLSEDKRQKALFDFWKKYDPNPATAFNQLMYEFYQRIDYCAVNFSTIDGKNGVDTDRGKILIQLGKPRHIERAYNEYGKIVETWVYEKPARKFIFVDQKGTGDFSLING